MAMDTSGGLRCLRKVKPQLNWCFRLRLESEGILHFYKSGIAHGVYFWDEVNIDLLNERKHFSGWM